VSDLLDIDRSNLGPPLPGAERIAVLRANSIGDFLVALPALEALRAAYPAARITLLGCDWHAAFLRGRPGPVDRVMPVPGSAGVRDDCPPASPRELAAFFRRQRAERYDLAIQLHGGGANSNPFTRRLGARVTAGSRAPDAEALDRWVPYRCFQHEIFRFLEVVGLVGAAPVTLTPRIVATGEDRLEAERALPPDPAGRPLVVLHPGAADPRRRWPAGHFAQVARCLAERGCQVVACGGAGAADRELTAAVAAVAPVEDLGGRLSLGGLAGLLARCRLLVGNDSGPRHLAEAVGVPTVGVYWCGNLVNVGPLTRTRHRVLTSWRLDCPVCGANCLRDGCGHQASFVADVNPGEVLAEAADLLNLSRMSEPV
jgi:ADP-heptose:LPS heptosyltransferase